MSADSFFLFWDLEQDLTMRHSEGLQVICKLLLLKRQIENMCWRCFITLKNCVSIASWQSRASVIQESSNSRNPCATHAEYYCLLNTFDNKFTAQNTKPFRIHAEKIYTVMLPNQTESNISQKSIIWNQIQILTSRNTMLLNPLNKPRGPYGNKSKIIFESKKN